VKRPDFASSNARSRTVPFMSISSIAIGANVVRALFPEAACQQGSRETESSSNADRLNRIASDRRENALVLILRNLSDFHERCCGEVCRLCCHRHSLVL
jgi:hypothetical protein